MTDSRNPTLLSRAEAAFVALAAGDALGWPQEFRSRALDDGVGVTATPSFRAWRRRGGGQFFPHEERILPGEYSDDTQLALAVARCRVFSGTSWWGVFSRTELPLWSLYERGGGGATKRAVEMWTRGTPPWTAADMGAVQRYFDAGGNGVAMRVLPHAIFYACGTDPAQLVRDVITDGVVTHGHPRALVGATAYAFAAWWLLRAERTVQFGELIRVLLKEAKVWGALPEQSATRSGWFEAASRSVRGGYEVLWSSVVDEMCDLLDRADHGLKAGAVADDEEVLRSLGCFGKAGGAGTTAAAAAAYLCSRYAAQPVQAVIKAAFSRRADTDTIASMSGGLVGCLAGLDCLPSEWTQVQDHEYLRQIAGVVARGPSSARERPSCLRMIGQKELEILRAALVERCEGEIDLDGVRSARVVEFQRPKPLSRLTAVQRWRLLVSDGQTLYVTKLGRPSASDMPPDSDVQMSAKPARTTAEQSLTAPALAVGLKLTVTDIKAMTAFYEEVLGLRPGRHSHRFVSFGALSLISAEAAIELSEGAVAGSQAALRHRIQVQVVNLEAVFGRVQDSGGKILQPIREMPWRERVFHCVDPEGNLVEVTERP